MAGAPDPIRMSAKPPPLPPRPPLKPPPRPSKRPSTSPTQPPPAELDEEAKTRVQSLQRRASDMVYAWREFSEPDQRWFEELVATWHTFTERDKRWLRELLHVMRGGK